MEKPRDFSKLRDMCMETTLHFHHDSCAKGYVGVNNEYIDFYEGRFGKGFVRHLASKDSVRYSRAFHTIEYYVF